MEGNVEKEMCNNCKKEIPQPNYVMHTMHCARNITMCKVCNEPIPKLEYEIHRETCRPRKPRQPSPPPSQIERSSYFQQRKAIEDQKAALRRENYMKKHEHLIDNGFTMRETVNNGYRYNPTPTRSAISPPRNMGPARTFMSPVRNTMSPVRSAMTPRSLSTSSSSSRMYGNPPSSINRQFSNSSYNSTSGTDVTDQASDTTSNVKSAVSNGAVKKPPLIPRLDDMAGPRPKGPQGLLPCRYCDLELPKLELEDHENYCGSRTDKCLECGELVMFKNKQVHMDSNHGFVKLNDEPGPRPSWDSTTHRSASTSSVDPSPTRRRLDRFRLPDVDYDPMPYLPAAYQPGGGLKKNKEGESYKEISRRLDCPAPQPPRRRRNPPTELTIPCEFCDTPIPHEDLIEHETGCRPDLARFNPRRSRSSVPAADEDDYFEAPRMRTPPRSDSPDSEDLPCEFCDHMVPASQLWRHQLSCTPSA